MALAKILLGNWILSHPNVTILSPPWNYINKGQHSKIRCFRFAHPFYSEEDCVRWTILRNSSRFWKRSGATFVRHTIAKKFGSPSRLFSRGLRLTDRTYFGSTRSRSMQTWDGTKMAHAVLLYAKRFFASLSLSSSSMSSNKAGPIASSRKIDEKVTSLLLFLIIVGYGMKQIPWVDQAIINMG